MKNKSKQRTNWQRQERDSKGRFKRHTPCMISEMYDEKLYDEIIKNRIDDYFTLEQLEHAFLSGLKANNSFYPPSKLWEFYKRDRGLV